DTSKTLRGRHLVSSHGGWRVRVHAARRACATSPPPGGMPARGVWIACWRGFVAAQGSFFVPEELSFKLAPLVKQSVPGKDGLETFSVENTSFDELNQTRLVLGASGLQRDGGQMFR